MTTTRSKPPKVGMHGSCPHQYARLCKLWLGLGISLISLYFHDLWLELDSLSLRLPTSLAVRFAYHTFPKITHTLLKHGSGLLWCSSALSFKKKKGKHRNSTLLTHSQEHPIHTHRHKPQEQMHSYPCRSSTIIMLSTQL